MANETPSFWWKKRSIAGRLLAPAAFVYGRFARRAMERAKPPRIDAPVLCIGNFTLGGAGKTPLAIAFAKAAKKQKLKPGIVSRGYGGTLSSRKNHIHMVDPAQDRARETGDEPLLLAEFAPVAIGIDRRKAAERLLREGADFIIMDDGFQSRRLCADYALLAVDGRRGLGNGRIFPAGPLRAPLPAQLAYCDSVAVLEQADGSGGDNAGEQAVRAAAKAGKPVYRAVLRSFIARPYAGLEKPAEEHKGGAAGDNRSAPIANMRAVKGRRFLAFAGIGNPEKFFAGITDAGGIIAQKRSFADHHFFSKYDIEDIVQSAEAHDLVMVTTAKDYMRLKTDGLDKNQGYILVMDVRPEFAREDFCGAILDLCVRRYKDRCFS